MPPCVAGLMRLRARQGVAGGRSFCRGEVPAVPHVGTACEEDVGVLPCRSALLVVPSESVRWCFTIRRFLEKPRLQGR